MGLEPGLHPGRLVPGLVVPPSLVVLVPGLVVLPGFTVPGRLLLLRSWLEMVMLGTGLQGAVIGRDRAGIRSPAGR